METVYNFINGKQVPSRGTKAHPIYNPATGEQIRQVIMSSPDDVNEARLGFISAFNCRRTW